MWLFILAGIKVNLTLYWPVELNVHTETAHLESQYFFVNINPLQIRVPFQVTQCLSRYREFHYKDNTDMTCVTEDNQETENRPRCQKKIFFISMVSCQKGPTRHAYAWQIGPFLQETLDIWVVMTYVKNGLLWYSSNMSSKVINPIKADQARPCPISLMGLLIRVAEIELIFMFPPICLIYHLLEHSHYPPKNDNVFMACTSQGNQ